MNYLITGGAGFIGSHLSKKLLSQGHKVVALDSFEDNYPKSVKQSNLFDIKDNPNYSLIAGDINETDRLVDILEGKKIGSVIHLAASTGIENSIKNPLNYIQSNIKGTLSLLEAMRESEVNKMIFASSSSVYGNQISENISENDPFGVPQSVYAASKQSAEIFCKMYVDQYQLSILAFRLFAVYGPGQRPDQTLSVWKELIDKNKPLKIKGNSDFVYNYTHIDDVCHAFENGLQYLNQSKQKSMFEILNIGNSQSITSSKIWEIINQGKEINFQGKISDKSISLLPNIEQANQKLNFTINTSYEKGIKHFFEQKHD